MRILIFIIFLIAQNAYGELKEHPRSVDVDNDNPVYDETLRRDTPWWILCDKEPLAAEAVDIGVENLISRYGKYLPELKAKGRAFFSGYVWQVHFMEYEFWDVDPLRFDIYLSMPEQSFSVTLDVCGLPIFSGVFPQPF